MGDNIELLFFDTFSHESSGELNLDLVQFPKPVFISEVRIIPLGARVQADFPGGVRLGATNPSQFKIEFFVNDLSKPGASTFESLGDLEYKQNVNIQLECDLRSMGVQIPTDGLVLRGWYTTITLAVYGALTKSLQESVTTPQSIVPHSVPQAGSNPRTPDSHNSTNADWVQQHPQVNDLINSERNSYIESSNLNQDPYNNNYNNEQFHSGDYPHHNFREEWQQPLRIHHGDGFDSNKDSLRWENNGSSKIDGSGDKLSWDRSKERDTNVGGPRGGYHSHRTLGRRERGNWDQSRHSWETSQPPHPHRKTAPSLLPLDMASAGVEASRKRPRSPAASTPSGVLAVAQQQSSSPPKRPYTPPVDPKPPQCDLDVKKETTVNQKFDSLSPGDVESISEGEIPDGEAPAAAPGAAPVNVSKPATPLEVSGSFEGTASSSGGLIDDPNTLTHSGIPSPNVKNSPPPSSAEQPTSFDSNNQSQPLPPPEAEQFEPILSDEEILDEVDGQFPDIDYHEYIDENGKHFNPYTCEFQPIQFFGEFGIIPSKPDSGVRLKELTIGQDTTENWMHLAEQAYSLVVSGLNQLNYDQNVIDILISWIDIGLDVEAQILDTSLLFQAAAKQPQPGYMIRHLKAGIRLSEVMCQCPGEKGQRLVLRLIDKEKLQQRLFMLYRREHMALSIQLMAVSALDASIRTPSAARTLLNEYPQLVSLLESSHLARTKYAWMALLRKLHICEALTRLRETAATLVQNRQRFLQSSSDLEAACACLEEIIRVHKEAIYSVAQHRRFLPVTSQFELDSEGLANPYPSLFALYQAECLLESCLVIAASSGSGFSHVFNFLHVLIMESQTRIGLQFLASHPQVSTALVRLLLASGTPTAEELGLAFAYRLQALYHLDQMNELLLREPKLDPNEGEFFEQLQALSHLGIGSSSGRTHLVHILALDDSLDPILSILKNSPTPPVLTPNSENSNTDHESPARLYASDLIVWTLRHSDHVPFLKRYGKDLFQLASEANDRLMDGLSYLRPLENSPSIFQYDDLSPICEIVKRHVDSSAQLPGELCTALRILNYLCVPSSNFTYLDHPELDLYEEPILSGGESNELKYKYALLQLFSLDGMTLMTNILKRICEAHPQPQIHSVILAGRKGRLLLSIALPCLQLLRRMLTQVIRCRGSEFRDLTAVPILLDVFALAQAVPMTATHQPKAATVGREAITALLAYTQPTLQAAEAPSNSLWTQALAEVLKWTSASPHSFISGLFILSELLPLTLPVITRVELSAREISRAINARLLWSAHLHPLASQIHELIGLLASSSCQPLVQMLRRVCVQLSDLAAPSSMLVMRGVLDAVLNTTQSCLASSANSTSGSVCSGHATRLLGFLASLTAHASIKCALVQLVARGGPAKNDEKYLTLIPTLTSILRKSAPDSNTHIQAQECALSIIQSLCDSELSLATGSQNDINLANALPPKDTLATLCHSILEHLSEKDHPLTTTLAAIRALLVIIEHDYGFQQLRIGLERHHPEALIILFNKIKEHLKDNNNTECLSLLTTSLELVRVCLSLDPEEDHVFRTLTLSVSELAQMLHWNFHDNESSSEGNVTHSEKNLHSIIIIEKLLQELISTPSNCDQESIESLYENISSLIRLLNEEGQIKSMDQSNNESFNSFPNLSTPDTLLVQFAMRQVYVLTNSSEINDDERLGSAYWLSIPLTEENETESDLEVSQRVPCDLLELSRQLIPEFQLVSETDKICRLNNDIEPLPNSSTSGTSTTQNSSLIGVVLGNNGSDPIAQNSSSSTNVEANKTGRPFVAPMRGRGGGFGRSIPLQRGGDLFRSRPPNTSRPPSLHVDDFVALEITGQQPTGPTGYNKMSATASLLVRGGPGGVGASLGNVGASGSGGGNGPPMVSILGNRNNVGSRGIGPRNSGRFFGASSLLSPYSRRQENGRGISRGIGMGIRLNSGGGRGNTISSTGISISSSVSLSNPANVSNTSTVTSWSPEVLIGSNSTGSGVSGSTPVGNSMAVRELRMITSSNTSSNRSIGGNVWPLSKSTAGERGIGVSTTTRRDLLPPRHSRTFPR